MNSFFSQHSIWFEIWIRKQTKFQNENVDITLMKIKLRDRFSIKQHCVKIFNSTLKVH